jgi:hypothetical protein
MRLSGISRTQFIFHPFQNTLVVPFLGINIKKGLDYDQEHRENGCIPDNDNEEPAYQHHQLLQDDPPIRLHGLAKAIRYLVLSPDQKTVNEGKELNSHNGQDDVDPLPAQRDLKKGNRIGKERALDRKVFIHAICSSRQKGQLNEIKDAEMQDKKNNEVKIHPKRGIRTTLPPKLWKKVWGLASDRAEQGDDDHLDHIENSNDQCFKKIGSNNDIPVGFQENNHRQDHEVHQQDADGLGRPAKIAVDLKYVTNRIASGFCAHD